MRVTVNAAGGVVVPMRDDGRAATRVSLARPIIPSDSGLRQMRERMRIIL